MLCETRLNLAHAPIRRCHARNSLAKENVNAENPKKRPGLSSWSERTLFESCAIVCLPWFDGVSPYRVMVFVRNRTSRF